MFVKTFRNTLIASTLLVGASLMVGPAAMAAPDPSPNTSGGDTVSGQIELINQVTFTPEGTQQYLTPGDVAMTGATFPMGNLTIRNNALNGWTLGVTSANAGKLKLGATSYQIAYTNLTVDTIPGTTSNAAVATLLATPVQVAVGAYNATVAAGTGSIAVTAQLGAIDHLPAGLYTDTVTFTITAAAD